MDHIAKKKGGPPPPPVPPEVPELDPNQNQANESNPLLIGEIADHILSFLDRSRDLESCFDVCKLWRNLVPRHNIRLRLTRPRMSIMNETDINKFLPSNPNSAYSASIRKHPSFKSTKFCLQDIHSGRLASSAMQDFFKEHGEEMEELVLCYSHYSNFMMIKEGLEDLLRHRVPNLKTLITAAVPKTLLGANLFEVQPNTTTKTTALNLTRIEFTANLNWEQQYTRSLPPLFTSILMASPRLEDFELIELGSGERISESGRLAESTIQTLAEANQLTKMKKLGFMYANFATLRLLSTRMAHAPNQLVSLVIDEINYGQGPPLEVNVIQKLLNSQSGSLEHLQLPLFNIDGTNLTLPPMPKLMELHLIRDHDKDRPIQQLSLVHQYGNGSLNYAEFFPRLQVLGLKGLLENYVVDEIFADPEISAPSFTMKILREMPVALDQRLMSRIVRLFPNLTSIRIPIKPQHENLLVTIWECCQNVSDLSLIFSDDTDANQENMAPLNSRCLDSLFSGIPDSECRRLRVLQTKDLKCELWRLGITGQQSKPQPSLRDLKKLRRLSIEGSPNNFPSRGDDQLSHVFGYSTLLAVAVSQEFVVFEAELGLAELGLRCIEELCQIAGFDWKLFNMVPTRFGADDALRLFKPVGSTGASQSSVFMLDWFNRHDQYF